MTDTHYDRAPGDASALPDVEQGTSSGVLVYTIGLVLAVVLTAMSFWVANTSLFWAERQHDASGRADESANAALKSVAGILAANQACRPCAVRFRESWWLGRSGGGCDRRT